MLHIQFHEAVAEIRMDRPPANALNRELVERLLAALETARMDGAHAIVLTGRPGMFSGGLDVPELLALDRRQIETFWGLFFSLTRQLAASPVPVIAAVSGHAPAGGAVLALHCDWRIGVAGRYRIGLNEVQVGLPVPGTVLVALEQAVGPRLAHRLATRGEMLSMEDAAAVGLLDELVAPEQLLPTALARANELLALPPVAMNTTRLAARARLIEALSSPADVASATGWWFSAETQAGMRKLVARLQKS
ncbi:MAG: enoyl-CoA hydratase/isomerase family protein [Chromatiales bacterium]|nr:enoyl-CoA hydratase/isomerase family protein [Chromatiales bacterium]